MKGYTVFAKDTGMEIRAVSKINTEETSVGKEGRISLRFFTFGNSDMQTLKFILTPLEAYSLCLFTADIIKKGGKQTLTHKFQGEVEEVSTTLTLEKAEKENKSGYAYSIKRGDSNAITVSLDVTTFLYVGELLKALSLEQAWSSYKASDDSETVDSTEAGESVTGKAGSAEKKTAGSSGNGNRLTGEIEDVGDDCQGFKLVGKWFKITDRTRREAEVTKGNSVSLYFSEFRGDLYANAIYPVKKG
jgi:hypothetical protein